MPIACASGRSIRMPPSIAPYARSIKPACRTAQRRIDQHRVISASGRRERLGRRRERGVGDEQVLEIGAQRQLEHAHAAGE